ncbi:MAG: permease-like cell division protein FtsX [Nitrosomonadales bacterium]|nr:permease-like cell division protein FtsX [Nitrosomonadales bacterium]
MKHWLNQHTQAIELVLKRMKDHLLATILMFVVMGVTLCLPGTLYVIVDNLNRLAGTMQSDPQISLFLKLDADSQTVNALAEKLDAHPNIEKHRFASKESAWEQLQKNTETAAVAVNLEQNPLPDAYFVTPIAMSPEEVEILQAELQQWEGVELAQLDTSWIKRLNAFLQLGKKGILVLVVLLGFALIVIIGNTIRLQIMTQREEIEVSKLIGATDSFIRRPFLYAGTIYGLGGGLVAWLLLVGIISLFNISIADLAELYASGFRLDLPTVQTSVSIIGSAVLLSWVGSYIAVNRSLSQLDLN